MADMKCLRFALTLAGIAAGVVATAAQPQKKLVAFAWEFSGDTPQKLVKLAEKLDATPLDGIGIKLRATAEIDGVRTNLHYKYFMHGPAWPKAAFADQIPYLKEATKHKSMKHCFASSFRAPFAYIPWEDDAAWARIAASMRTVAWVAKEGGLKGLSVDPEDYKKVRQFVRRGDEAPYDELCKLVRRRAREVFGPVFEEYPEATVHFFWFMAHVKYYTKCDRADLTRMSRVDEDLWPAFANGVLDVLPRTATIQDGDEEAYSYLAEKNGYRNGAYMFHSLYPQVVAPENLEKYRNQVKYTPAVYLDMYTNAEGASWYKAPLEGTRLERLRKDVIQATDVSGGTIWFWGEKHPWIDRGETWNKPDGRILDTTWEEELPGLHFALEWVKDPVALFDRTVADLAAKGNLVNLAAKDSVSVTNGYVTVGMDVKGGEYYGVAFDVKGVSARVNVFFKDAKGKYVQPSINMIYPDDARGVVRVPEGGATGTIVFSAENKSGEKSVFSNLRVYRLR